LAHDATSRYDLLLLLSYLARQLEATRERFVLAHARIRNPEATMGKTVYQLFVDEGRDIGQQEGRVQLLLRQFHRRFGDVPLEVEARLRAADVATLDTIAERLLDAATIDALFA
jgi:glutathione S-transferase